MLGAVKVKENFTIAWVAVWFATVGQLLFFVGLSLYTGEWGYAMWSLWVAVVIGIPTSVNTWRTQIKKEQG